MRGMNSLLGKWLLDQVGRNAPNAVANEPADGARRFRHLHRLPMRKQLDYYDEPADARVVPLLVECNFLGRVPGEEGW